MNRLTLVGMTLSGAGALLLVVALLVGQGAVNAAPQAQAAAPTIAEIQANPGSYYDQVVTIDGVVAMYVDENEFLLDDGTGQIIVDAGPPWYQQISTPTGSAVSITGQIDFDRRGQVDLDACQIVAGGSTTAIRDCSFRGPPPWAGGPERGERGDERGDDRDDD